MRTSVYVDGFNVYYRLLYNTDCKWLDIKQAVERLLGPSCSVQVIKYFTAPVDGKYDTDQPSRQNVYLKALQAFTPQLTVHLGYFRRDPKFARLLYTAEQNAQILLLNPRPEFALIETTEEKGSDVNLATHVLNDAYQGDYECAAIVSNDGDLAEALRLVKTHCQKKIALISPGRGRISGRLRKYSDFTCRLRLGTARVSQLPDPIPGTSIHKPVSW